MTPPIVIHYLGSLTCAGYIIFETDKEVCLALVGVNAGTVRIPKTP